jgi:hypothetical protein
VESLLLYLKATGTPPVLKRDNAGGIAIRTVGRTTKTHSFRFLYRNVAITKEINVGNPSQPLDGASLNIINSEVGVQRRAE